MPSQFIVHWKNGDVTVERAKDVDSFFNDVLIEYEEDIVKAEHDHRIVVPKPGKKKKTDLSAQNAFVNWGLSSIEASAVWPQADGSGITVAVVDSGVEITHPQLQPQLFVNPAEANGAAGVDDDGNGFVDDVHGWDFVNNTGNITDVLEQDSHGTHVAGIIAAQHQGNDKVMGVAPGAKILPLNFMDASRGGTLGDAIKAIDYAAEAGARVINASWGAAICSTILQDKVAQLGSQGVLFVAAAGNSGSDITAFPEYPAAYSFAHQITVGASTANDLRASFSNFSTTLVDLLAPGVDIFSTVAFDDMDASKDGTSMATPFVAGAAAVLLSSKPNATPSQIKDAISQSVDTNQNIVDVKTRGRLNLRKAFNHLNGANL